MFQKSIKTKARKKVNKLVKNKSLKFYVIIKKHKVFFSILTGLILFLIAGYIVLSQTFLSTQHTIENLNFTQDNIDTFDDAGLYKTLKELIIGKNYFITKYELNSDILRQIQEKYKIIESLYLMNVNGNEIALKVNFYQPSLVLYDGLRYTGVYKGYMFDISQNSLFLSGATIINLPEYIQNFEYMTGFFYIISEETLKKQIQEIQNTIGKDNITKITYLPGGSKTIISTTDEKEIYFDNTTSIVKQLQQYITLRTNYDDFDKIKNIDLSNIEYLIIKNK